MGSLELGVVGVCSGGCVELWACGFVSVWICGVVGLWICGLVELWPCWFLELGNWGVVGTHLEVLTQCDICPVLRMKK